MDVISAEGFMNPVKFIHKNLLAPLLISKPATVSCFRRLKCHKMTDQARDYGRADAVFNDKNWALGRYIFSLHKLVRNYKRNRQQKHTSHINSLTSSGQGSMY